MNSYTVYHLHSDYSLLDSCSKFSEYVDLAVEQGMTAIASTEHGKPSGWVEKKMYCDSHGIKFIHGVEIYLTESLDEKVRDNFHTVLLAKNYDGVMELNKLIELSTRTDHMYYTNRLTFDEFLSISPNIIKISACLASPLAKLPRYHEMYQRLVKHYDYLQIQHHNVPDQAEYNKQLMALSKKYNKPLIAGTDTHSASPYKAVCRDILMEYKQQHYEGEEQMDLVWKTYDELVKAYEIQGALPRGVYMEAIQNTNRMADSVQDFTLDKTPKYPLLTGSRESDEEQLHKVTWRMLDEKLKNGTIPPEQQAQFRKDIEQEFVAFHKTNMSGFMLSMSKIISWCRSSNIPIGPCRGSVGGSRVAYVTDIIDLNPIVYNTVFSRFCNENRVELGDIDVDCIDSDRPRIFEYIINTFGAQRCARVASYGTIADLSFIDDAGGGLAIKWEREHHPEKFGENGRFDKVKTKFDTTNPYHPNKLAQIKSVYKNDSEEAKAKFPDLFQYYDGMVDTKVSQSVHPAGMVISSETLDDHWGVFNKDGERCLFIDMEEAHDVMLVKYDLLILKTVAVIARTCKLAGKKYPRMHEINFNDPAVWESICKDQDAIFQFESQFGADSIAKFKPRSIDDISVVNAAIRPSGTSYRDDLLQHKVHKNPTAQIDAVLKDSLGYLVYQEQTIAFLKDVCGLSAGYADTIRRAIGKKDRDKIEKAMPQILEGYCANSEKPRDVAQEEAKEFLKVIEDASAYSFGKNHSIGYSLLSYLCGYYRYYYTEQFVAAYMSQATDDDDIATGKRIAQRYGITISTPEFRQDNRDFYIDKKNHLISGTLSTIKGIGLKDAQALYELGNGFYVSFVDLLYDMRQFKGALNKTVIDTLIKLDYFRQFGTAGKLTKIFDKFQTALKNQNLKKQTVDKRMMQLYSYEQLLPQEQLSPAIRIPLEIEVYGQVKHVYPDMKKQYAVISVDEKFSPKLQLCSLATGKIGAMKVLKPFFNHNKVGTGDIILVKAWTQKNVRVFQNGKSVPVNGKFEYWIDEYEIQSRHEKEK